MSARSYDVILTVNSVTNFESKNVVIGVTTGTTGVIANVDASTNTLKVKLNNVLQEFKSSETIRSNIITLSTSANGALNTTSLPFQSNTMSGNTTTATATPSQLY